MFNLFFCQSDDTRQGTACKGKKRSKLWFFEDFLRFGRWKALAERFWRPQPLEKADFAGKRQDHRPSARLAKSHARKLLW
jgi:hypothetical protein